MQSLSHLDKIVFLSQLISLSIENYQQESLTLRISKGDDVFFENTYHPDESGTITVYELNKLFEPRINYDLLSDNVFKVECNGVSIVDPTDNPQRKMLVIPMKKEAYTPAVDYVESFYLCSGIASGRNTAKGRKEIISLYCPVQQEMWCDVLYEDQQLQLHHETVSMGNKLGFHTVDVSLEVIRNLCNDVQSGDRILSYSVHCGRRVIDYYVERWSSKADPVIMFRNCFGFYDIISFTGLKTQSTNYTYSTANVGIEQRMYEVEEETLYTATSPKMAAWDKRWLINDLAVSPEIYTLDKNYNVLDRIVITEVSDKATNTDTDLEQFQITYRRASLFGDYERMKARPRIFDETFDQKFE